MAGRNPLLHSYQNSGSGAAGNYPRVKDLASVSSLLQDSGNQYGASHSALESWKRNGIPTAEQMPTSVAFGLSTRRGDTVAQSFTAAPAEPLPNYARLAAGQRIGRVNPITWLGGDDEPDGGPPSASSRMSQQQLVEQAQMMQQLQHMKQAQQMPPPPAPELSAEQMQQTWSELMRSRKRLPLSSAQSMIHMPEAYSIEAPPPRPALDSQSLMTIGLHATHGANGRPIRRSNKFTNDFVDPFA